MKPLHDHTGAGRVRTGWHLYVGLAVLALIVLTSWIADTPVRIVYPYAFAVGLVAWGHGLIVSFSFAALATLAALATGAFPSRVEFTGQELGEGLYTYLLLSAVAACVSLGKRAGWRPVRSR